jgi:hypothetical protein
VGSFDEVAGNGRLHQFEGELGYPICLYIFLNHPGKFDDFLPVLLFFVLNLSGQLQRLVFLTEDKVLQLLQVQLLHVNLLLSGTLGVVIFGTLRIFTLHCSPTSCLLAGKALALKSFAVDVLDPLDTDHPVLLFEVALRHPDGADVMNPDVVAHGDIRGVCGLHKVVVIALFLLFTLLTYHFDLRLCVLRLLLPLHLLF